MKALELRTIYHVSDLNRNLLIEFSLNRSIMLSKNNINKLISMTPKASILIDETLNTSTTLWRFMNFEKFCSMLQTGSIYLASQTQFDDPWEGMWPRKNNSTTSVDEVNKALSGAMRTDYENRKYIKISCWHINEHESEYFWRLYSNMNSGIAIKASVGKLVQSLSTKDEVKVLPVTYVDYNSVSVNEFDLYTLASYKRQAFSHENELRIVKINTNNKYGEYLSVDLGNLIEEVVISPFAGDWFIEVVKHLLRMHQIKSVCYKSKTYESPTL